MKSKCVLLLVATSCFAIATSAQDERAKIKDYLNQEIIIEDKWAGQSMTLIKEKRDYFILHKLFGSGIPVIDSAKYEVEFNSDYQIAFVGHLSSDTMLKENKEVYLLRVEDQGLCLYFNGLKVVTRQSLSPAKK